MIRMTVTGLILALATFHVTAATAAPHTYVLQGDKVAGGLLIGRGNPPDAAFYFGTPQKETRLGITCHASWPGIGLSVTFVRTRLNTADACQDGIALGATITSRTAWRTSRGARIGDST